jgi:hypothetical protein
MNDNLEILFNKLGTLTYTISRLENQLESLYKDRDTIYRSINEQFEGNRDNLDRTEGSDKGESTSET